MSGRDISDAQNTYFRMLLTRIGRFRIDLEAKQRTLSIDLIWQGGGIDCRCRLADILYLD